MTITLHHPDVITESREDAIASGDLVDVTAVARKMRYRVPVALTREAYDDCVHWDDAIEDGKTGFTAQETEGRLHDLVWLAICSAREASRGSSVHFTLRRVPREGKASQPRPVTLRMVIGPGDRGEPVVTIGFPSEFENE